MTKGTKLRTILRIAASFQNTAVILTGTIQAFSSEYHIGWLTFAWAIFAIVCDFVVSTITTYYNNDYTPEACEGTGYTRLQKLRRDDGAVGEDFFDEIEEEEQQ